MPNLAPQVQTTDAGVQAWPFLGQVIEPDSICKINVFVFASDHAGAFSTWTGTLTVGRDVDVKVQIAGGIGQTVDWLLVIEEPVCMSGPYVPPP